MGRTEPLATVVFAHPAQDSFNHRVLERVVATLGRLGRAVEVLDLYRMEFDPVLPLSEIRSHFSFDPRVQRCSTALAASEAVIFVYPDWWGGPPAILKGFLDRVWRPGVAYDFVGDEEAGREHRPLFGDKRILVLCTTDHPVDRPYPAKSVWEDLIVPFCGAAAFEFHCLFDLRNTSWADRQSWLVGVDAILSRLLS